MKKFVDIVMLQDCGKYEQGQQVLMSFAAAHALVESRAARFGKTEPKQAPKKINAEIQAIIDRNNFNEMRSAVAKLVSFSTVGITKARLIEILNAEKYN